VERRLLCNPLAGNTFPKEDKHRMFSAFINICTVIGAIVGVVSFVLYLLDR
jgi:hypothetical protein